MKNSDLITQENISVSSEKNAVANCEKDCNGGQKNLTLMQRVSGGKIFHKKDLWVYFSLVIIVACLFIFLIFPSLSKGDVNGFLITQNGKTVLVFKPNSSQLFSIETEFADQVDIKEEENGIYTVKIFSSPQKTGYNVLVFNTKKVSVKVTESTCSNSKDCVYCPELTKSGSIYCAPHHLKITPVSGSGFIPPTTG